MDREGTKKGVTGTDLCLQQTCEQQRVEAQISSAPPSVGTAPFAMEDAHTLGLGTELILVGVSIVAAAVVTVGAVCLLDVFLRRRSFYSAGNCRAAVSCSSTLAPAALARAPTHARAHFFSFSLLSSPQRPDMVQNHAAPRVPGDASRRSSPSVGGL